MKQNQGHKYAVTVRDGENLFLVATVCRSRQGDVYVNVPRGYPGLKAHISHHASGQSHVKSYDHKYFIRARQKPDVNFKGTFNMSTMGISSFELRQTYPQCEQCKTEAFDAVFEIPVSELWPEQYRTYVSVDLAEPGGPPIIYPGAQILQQMIFQDSIPWILVTLFDTK